VSKFNSKAALGKVVLHPRAAHKIMQEIQQAKEQAKFETDLSRSESEVLRLLIQSNQKVKRKNLQNISSKFFYYMHSS
jgi:DNA-binding NarL/FixJ family response regulator